MKILLVNKFFFPFGGTETALFESARLLRRLGHEVIFFSMAHPNNLDCAQARFFAPRVDFEQMHGWRQKLVALRRALFGHGALQKLDELLRAERPDVAHLHNIYHHLSPAIIATLKRRGVPVVMTLHDYKTVCPAYKLFRRSAVCEQCRGGRFRWCLLRRCIRGSFAKSLVALLEARLHRRHYAQVDRFVCPSRFLAAKVREMGLPGRFVEIGNFAAPAPPAPPGAAAAPRVVYFGRLVEEKGVDLLIDAMDGVDAECLVVGDGPLRGSLQARAAAAPAARVRFLGQQLAQDLAALVRSASLVVVPSLWYENNPFAVLESFALGTPVLAARIGGIPELVIDNETGLLFTAGDRSDLRGQMLRLLHDPGLGRRLAANARQHLERNFHPERHGEKLQALYRETILTRSARVREAEDA